MSPAPHHFLAMLVLLLPAFLLPARVELCLAGWVECEACPCGALGEGDAPGELGDQADADDARSSCCHPEPSAHPGPTGQPAPTPEDEALRCCCCEPGPTITRDTDAPRPFLASR